MGELNGKRGGLGGWVRVLLVGPGYDGDFRAAVPSKRQERPSEAAIHIHPVAGVVMWSGESAATSGRKPKGRNSGDLPLTAVAVTAQNQVDGMFLVQNVDDAGGTGQG